MNAACIPCRFRKRTRCTKDGRPVANRTDCPLGMIREQPDAVPGAAETPLPLTFTTRDRRFATAVVIISHNYGRFLAEAIESAQRQTIHPAEIVVVDDNSTDDTAEVAARYDVQYLRAYHENVHLARNLGFRATEAEIVCFLDADDRLPIDYLAAGLPLFSDRRVGIVCSDMQEFGESHDLRRFRPDASPIHAENCAHAGSLVRRVALDASQAFEGLPENQAHADWWLWRRVVAAGWSIAHSPARYLYRRHPDAMMIQRDAADWFDDASLLSEQITLAIPLSGRDWFWDHTREWMERQRWPHDKTRLLLIDSSQSEQFGFTVRDWLAVCDYPQTQYVALSVAEPGVADRDRRTDPDVLSEVRRVMPILYNRARNECATEYLWIVEDDILPPDNASELLLEGFDNRTASVCLTYRHRYQPTYTCWKKCGRFCDTAGRGIVEIGGSGFGCTMIRRSVAEQFPFHNGLPTRDYDGNFYREIAAAHWNTKVNWDAICQHAQTEDVT